MAFHFSLQALLRYRESYEQRERLRLQIAAREVARAHQKCTEAEQERGRACEELAKKLGQGMNASELRFELSCDRARARRVAACKEQVAKLEELRLCLLEAFHKAHRQRKILENLRNRQLAAYRQLHDRRMQQRLDERFLTLHAGLPSS
jgi:flagellar export protein FliJ